MRRYAPFARDATADLRSLFLPRSLTHPRLLARSPSFCALSLAPSNFLLIVFVTSLLSLSPFSFVCPLLFFSLSLLLQHSCDAAHTRAREFRARYTTHMADRPLLLAECAVLPPAGDRVTWPPGRNGTQRAARAVLSREPRTRHQSETNRETGPTDRILSQEARVVLSPSLSFSDSFFLSLSISLSLALSPCTTTLSSLSLFSSLCFSARCARDISRPEITRVRPRVVSTI